MSTPEWDAKAAGTALFAKVKRVIATERSKAYLRSGRDATDAEIARAVLASPALLEASRDIMDGLEAEYKPKIAAMIGAGAGEILEQAAPAIRSAVAEEIARVIEESVCTPGAECGDRGCLRALADAALARKIGLGETPERRSGDAWEADDAGEVAR